ncbi:Ap4A phosphorylase II [Castellaniella defragrans 65Phen]|uniref:Ap4A phosphorylase II n=1 Tax=Castellaniella defragrans (strain DSM 12143 / CCUG 39792 / 65Phen) TaxID=1437824 RepID=W8X2X4_CASD6|nr:phosphorylase [Castellaniella defragrans]CDM23451.1 Ap4A phosphorylase II [Castellaniella defragrans 65Phen]
MDAVRARSSQAIASGELQPIVAEEVLIQDQGLPFTIRWVAALAAKDAAAREIAKDAAARDAAARGEAAGGPAVPDAAGDPAARSAAAGAPAPSARQAVVLPGGPRDPDFNPFLKPDPALLVGPVGEHHAAILNKFPVCLHHLVLARRAFAEQLSPLEEIDFRALASILSAEGGLGFYNGGAAAGASQRHKHVQWIPDAPGNASLRALAAGLPADQAQGAIVRHPALDLAHCFVRVDAGLGADAGSSARAMLIAFGQACAALDLRPGADGLLPPCNMLVGDGWMLVLPRSREHFQGVSLNALSFGGVLYVRDPVQVDAIRAAGPLRALASVGVPG